MAKFLIRQLLTGELIRIYYMYDIQFVHKRSGSISFQIHCSNIIVHYTHFAILATDFKGVWLSYVLDVEGVWEYMYFQSSSISLNTGVTNTMFIYNLYACCVTCILYPDDQWSCLGCCLLGPLLSCAELPITTSTVVAMYLAAYTLYT